MKTWVKNITRANGFNEQLVQEANAKIFTFGSYRLGVSKFSLSLSLLQFDCIYVLTFDPFSLYIKLLNYVVLDLKMLLYCESDGKAHCLIPSKRDLHDGYILHVESI